MAGAGGASRRWPLESLRAAVPVIVIVLAGMALLLGLIFDSNAGGIIFIALGLVGIQLRMKYGSWRLPAKGERP